MKKVIVVLMVMFLVSCESDMEKFNNELSEGWAIEEIYYLGESSVDSLNYNLISFNFPEEGNVYVPESFGYKEDRSVFVVLKRERGFEIKIITNNEVFNNTFKAKVLKDGRGMKQLTLTSDKLKIKAYARDLFVGFD